MFFLKTVVTVVVVLLLLAKDKGRSGIVVIFVVNYVVWGWLIIYIVIF
jgi:hypothetical protein